MPTTPMMTAEASPQTVLGRAAKVGIIAGGGSLPVQVAQNLSALGQKPFVLILDGEVEDERVYDSYERELFKLENFGSLVAILKRQGVTHAVLAGAVSRRPKLSAMHFNIGLLGWIPSVITALARGDDGLLKILVGGLERRGIKVVGPHELVPELLAAEGALTKARPAKSDWRDINSAVEAARAIGALDIGQAAVAIGGRVIALEGIEGTEGLLRRVQDMRGHGRLAGKARGVLVKCSKPGQELRADMPGIGPRTVDAAHAAGLAGIAVEAGRSLILDGPELVEHADRAGLFVVGLPLPEVGRGG